MKVNATPAAVLRLPYDSPVRRRVVAHYCREALHREEFRCACGKRYVGHGVPVEWYDSDIPVHGPHRFWCRNAKCRRPLP